jgi:hypothetical protein
MQETQIAKTMQKLQHPQCLATTTSTASVNLQTYWGGTLPSSKGKALMAALLCCTLPTT